MAPSSTTPSAPKLTPLLAEALTDGFALRLPERVKATREAYARARLDAPAPDGLPHGSDIGEFAVLQGSANQASDATRVVVDTKTVRVAVWFDHAELERVATARVPLAESPIGVPPETRIAHPGLRLKLEREQNGRALVTATYEFPSPDSGVLRLEGWVDRSKIGFVYRPSLRAESALRGKPSFVKDDTIVSRAPGKPPIARVEKGAQGIFFPVLVLAQHHGQAEVFVSTPELELRGFVPDAVLEELEPEQHRGWGRGHFDAGLWQRWPKEQVQIPAGTCIYDAPRGEAIGVVKQSQLENVVIDPDASDYRAYRLPHRAVGYLHVSDVTQKPDTSVSLSKESIAIGADAWTCPAH